MREVRAAITAASENPVDAGPASRERWLNELAESRGRLATGQHEPSVDFLVAEDRGH